MSRGINKVILVGKLGTDPELKHLPNGNSVANISIATSESWKDKNTGQKQEKTEWHRVVVFGKLAEIAGQYLTKGSQVYFEGKLQTRKWQDQAGQDKYTTEVVVDFNGQMQMLDSRQNQNQPVTNVNTNINNPPKQNNFNNPIPTIPNQPINSNIDFDDDIPF